MERITWTRSTGIGSSGWTGLVNGRRLFTITMSMTRGEGYVLRTQLPFTLKKAFTTGEDADLKARAERVLDLFVTSLGAVWPEED